jgi:iron complex transport system permease protein
VNRRATLLLLAILAVAVLATMPFVGVQSVPFSALWSPADDTTAFILWKLRIPRVLMAFVAGAGLAVSGMAFQAVFRNPLATPFTLGVASGASLGACVYIAIGASFSFLWVSGSSWFAFGGAILAIALVFGLTRLQRGFSTSTMLLAGVAISFFFSSLILFLQYMSDFTQSHKMLRWVMGGLERTVDFDDLLTVFPFTVAGIAVIFYLTHELNLLMTGEELAASRGVEVQRTKIAIFVVVSLMIGAVVSLCGPIGFVGLMAPHICRLLVGPDHRYLAPATILFGAAFLALCDTAARMIAPPLELPVGIITSLLGGPFFLWLLLRRSSQVAMDG